MPNSSWFDYIKPGKTGQKFGIGSTAAFASRWLVYFVCDLHLLRWLSAKPPGHVLVFKPRSGTCTVINPRNQSTPSRPSTHHKWWI
ncbi:hypothetical protein F2Q68_00039394 [Brassica cretica]|uniref:Uncharacterized protein n=2 Tax=Brassica cretica TaxID=69181 RepID=A0ABQ7ADH0_BRACR|nr:hypothetical protein F2Q68_00039394 [Brassica cretica]KAF3495697.1 hypothetical protein DY000_02052979 [Brassica cretica]